METTPNIIKVKDERTGKTYATVWQFNNQDYALKKLKERMDYDYLESLCVKDRISKKIKDLDFNCPFCLEKTEVSSRKEKITNGFFLFIHTHLIDIFSCHRCGNEFTNDKLSSKKDEIRRGNNVITNFENWKEAKREGKNPPEFISLDKVDEVIISSF